MRAQKFLYEAVVFTTCAEFSARAFCNFMSLYDNIR